MVYDSLVDAVRPGDRITVTGIFRTNPVRVNSRQRSMKSLFRTFVDVVHISKAVDGQRERAKAADDLSASDYMTGACDVRSEEEEREIEEKARQISQLPDLYETLSASLGNEYLSSINRTVTLIY